MLIDASKGGEAWFSNNHYEACICGAGPAGIALALRLAAKGYRVALLEGGGLEASEASQFLYKGSNVGLPYFELETCRLRFLGGSSNHWQGYIRPLESRDFDAYRHHPLNAWPIKKPDLDPYAAEAASILGAPLEQITHDHFAGRERELAPAVYSIVRPPTRIGEKYREALKQSQRIDLCINASLTDIRLHSNLEAVSAFRFRGTDSDAIFDVRARVFALCCGGLENPRILLNSRSQLPSGIGNQHDIVGRYFSEHPQIVVGLAVLAAPPKQPGIYIASDRILRDRQCLSFVVEVDPIAPERVPLVDRAICRFPLSERFAKLLLGRAPVCFDSVIFAVIQQAANADSRVMLADTRDRLGLRQIALRWRLTDLDRHTFRVAATEIGRALAFHDVGRMMLASWLQRNGDELPNLTGQHHHMCTTRMDDDPRKGVVDRNCRVHGLTNLYIGGSSVFSSSGISNPTYTIVQLALRLGDHLAARLR
jgi:hypothetical protein